MRFRYIAFAQQVIFGPGTLADLPEAASQFGWQRALLCVTRSMRVGGQAARLEAGLGERLAATCEPAQAHVPDFQVAEALRLAAQHEADVIIGMGGGSAIGLAKATAAALEEQRTGRPAKAEFPTEQPLVPVAAVPTTYSGSEMTAIYGVTRHEEGIARKVTATDPKVAPKLVLYDPELTLNLPPEVTASSGINALAHCVEAVYSIRRTPLASAAALEAIRRIAVSLPRCWAEGGDLEARGEMLLGAHLAGAALASVAMGLHHGLCHVLGGSAGVPHGIANAIVLPHAMRFNAEAVAPELAQVAEALGVERAGQGDEALALAGADKVAALVAGMRLPQRLREVGVAQGDLPRLAELALRSSAVKNNPRPVKQASEVEDLLRGMW